MAMSKAQKAKVKKVATKLKGASKAHAGQAKTLMGIFKKTKKRAK
jgi:hypothetical protein